jgi:hypothetical protein
MVNLKLDPVLQISPRAFKEILALNPNHQFELTVCKNVDKSTILLLRVKTLMGLLLVPLPSP